jgi:uncharacterized protein (DUF1800 family)
LTYSPNDSEVTRVAEIGLAGWIEEQLARDPIPELELRWRLRNLEALDKQADELEGYKRATLLDQLRKGTLIRRIYSRRQLYEMMVEFWSDHFNISVEKGDCWYFKVVDDRDVVRAHALGSFPELLHASASSPAMLVYLDNQANRQGAPNENYARELLELHTLGIDGGYTQEDIADFARSLTGWAVKEHFWHGRFNFNEDIHDRGSKRILGLEVPPGDQNEVEQVLDHLARHPSTARNLAIKLVRRFVTDDPENEAGEWVKRTQQAFLQSDGQITDTLRPLLLDGIARENVTLSKKFKRPVDFLCSALRVTDATTDAGRPLHAYLSRMGQTLFGWPTPDGPPDVSSYWQANLAPRWDFALRYVTDTIDGTELPMMGWLGRMAGSSAKEVIQAVSVLILGIVPQEHLVKALMDQMRLAPGLNDDQKLRAVIAGYIASPIFQYR